MTDERRRHRRVPALFHVMWEGAAGRHEARTGDLSVGGCFIDTTGEVTPGETISFRLRLPAGGWMELRGEVTYHFPNVGFGVRFTGVSEADARRIEWLVRAEGHRAEK